MPRLGSAALAAPGAAGLEHLQHALGHGVAADRIAGRAIIGAALDNLTKGASGQAVQNMNLMLGFPETMGLEQIALFP